MTRPAAKTDAAKTDVAKTDSAEIPVLDPDGNPSGSARLPAEYFGAVSHSDILHEVVLAYRAHLRRGTHSTKTRAEVRGGGRKPWRQKHLGRARAGSIRSPIWVGGGIAHGPHPRLYDTGLPRRKRRLALAMALSRRAQEGRVRVVAPFVPEPPKTKALEAWRRRLRLPEGTLLVVDRMNENLHRACRNLPDLTVEEVRNLNAYEVLRHGTLAFATTALRSMERKNDAG